MLCELIFVIIKNDVISIENASGIPSDHEVKLMDFLFAALTFEANCYGNLCKVIPLVTF